MKFVLFAALPYVGHLNPLLRQAEELQRRGWRVAVATAGEMAAHVAREAPSIPFVNLGALGEILIDLREVEALSTADPNYWRGGLRFLPVLDRIWTTMFDGLTEAMRRDRPDLLVVDIFSWWGFDSAELCGVATVANNPSLLTGVPIALLSPAPNLPFMTSGQSIDSVTAVHRALEPVFRRLLMAVIALTVERRINTLRRSRGLPATRLHEAVRGRPILVNGAFGLEYRRDIPGNVHMVGPMLASDVPALDRELADWLAGGPPVIYANLGTVSFATAEQLDKILDGLNVEGARALWVMKPAQAALLPRAIPPNVRIIEWLTSTRALLAHPNVAVFLSHCGINSVHESIAAGTPIVGIPMLADQRDMAARFADAGAGVWLDKHRFTGSQLRAAIDRVRRGASFRAAIPPIQDAFARAGGIPRAADIIASAAP